MTEIEAMYARHSVRNYMDKKIEAEKLANLNELIEELNQTGNLHLQLLEDAGRTFKRLLSRVMGLASAPSVIACVGPDDETLDERVGYYGEKLVLAAQQLGLNTCWAGTYDRAHVPANVKEGERLSIVIALGYGANQGKMHKSKTAPQVSVVEGNAPAWFDKAVEYALLAPTAINQQKFELHVHKDNSVSVTDQGGVLSKVDLGIVKYHVDLARE